MTEDWKTIRNICGYSVYISSPMGKLWKPRSFIHLSHWAARSPKVGSSDRTNITPQSLTTTNRESIVIGKSYRVPDAPASELTGLARRMLIAARLRAALPPARYTRAERVAIIAALRRGTAR